MCAGLHLLRLTQPGNAVMTRVAIRGPVASPFLLCFVGDTAGSNWPATSYIFLASKTFNSQLVSVTAKGYDQHQQDKPVTTAMDTDVVSGSKTTVSVNSVDDLSFVLSDAALVKSLAPVQDVCLCPDIQGADDNVLIAGGGVGGSGRLAKAKLGMALQPYFPSTTTLPVSVSIAYTYALGTDDMNL